MISADVPGPHHEPCRTQFAVSGKSLEHRQGATIIVIRDRTQGAWVVYLEGDPLRAIELPESAMLELVRKVTAELRVCGSCGGLGTQPVGPHLWC